MSGNDGTDIYRSEGVYFGSSGTNKDRSHHLAVRALHAHDLAAEAVEVKPYVTDYLIEDVLAARVSFPDDELGPTGAISASVNGGGAAMPPDFLDARGVIRNVEIEDVETVGHGAITLGFGGIAVLNSEFRRYSDAAVRLWVPTAPFAPDGFPLVPNEIRRNLFGAGRGIEVPPWLPGRTPIVEGWDDNTLTVPA